MRSQYQVPFDNHPPTANPHGAADTPPTVVRTAPIRRTGANPHRPGFRTANRLRVSPRPPVSRLPAGTGHRTVLPQLRRLLRPRLPQRVLVAHADDRHRRNRVGCARCDVRCRRIRRYTGRAVPCVADSLAGGQCAPVARHQLERCVADRVCGVDCPRFGPIRHGCDGGVARTVPRAGCGAAGIPISSCWGRSSPSSPASPTPSAWPGPATRTARASTSRAEPGFPTIIGSMAAMTRHR